MHSTETPATWRERLLRLWWAPILAPILGMIFVVVAWLVPWAAPRTPADLSAEQLARDEATAGRARAFVEALGFEPGGVVCRSTSSGSGWCTIRVAGSDKTFALYCSRRHPACVENRSNVDP